MKRLQAAQARSSFLALPAHQQGLIAVAAAAMLWSTGGLFIKWVSLGALGVTMWRSLFAGVTMMAITRTGLPGLRCGWVTWALALSYAVNLILFVSATKLTTAANAIFLQYTAPLYVLLFARFVVAERPTRFDVGCAAVAFAGMALFFVGRFDASNLAGNALGASSGVAFAIFLTLLRRPECTATTRPQAVTLGNALLVVTLVPAMLFSGQGGDLAPGVKDLSGLLVLGVVQIGLAYALFGYGIVRVEALEASLLAMLEPVFNPVWVFVFLGESPGLWAVVGGTVIVIAVATRTLVAERRRRSPPPSVVASTPGAGSP